PLYLGSTLYRIHGSNEPETIGQAVSSGCFRMTNEDVVDLYNRVSVGTTVVGTKHLSTDIVSIARPRPISATNALAANHHISIRSPRPRGQALSHGRKFSAVS